MFRYPYIRSASVLIPNLLAFLTLVALTACGSESATTPPVRLEAGTSALLPAAIPTAPFVLITSIADVSIRVPAPDNIARPANRPRPQQTPLGAPLLTLNEIERHIDGNGTVISYQVLASGFPVGKTYQLARLPLRGEPQVFNSEYHVEANGKLVSTTKPLDAERFLVGALAKGEALQFVLSATDHSTGAIAKAIPFPIEATGDGACHISLELGVGKIGVFSIQAEGFMPDEDLDYTIQGEGGVIQMPVKAQSDGTWATLSLPTGTGKDSGTDTISLAGKSCRVSVQYAWDKDALKAQ